MNIYYYKVTGINIPLFWRNILKMSIVPGTMLIVGIIYTKYIAMTRWLIFLVSVGVYSIIYAFLMYLFVMNVYEKEIIMGPIKKIINRFKR